VLLVDAANVIGSRPNGWWRDRAGAARAFVEQVRAATLAGRLAQPVIVVLEGKARSGVETGVANGVSVVHAPGSGDDTLLTVIAGSTDQVTLVSADRALSHQAEALRAEVVRPGWLIDQLDW
jgi:predicted ABC-type transport system involved in lysophospholipase L1 biosynthesis ATPase subunit